jgi:hypothetical protein
MKKTKDIIAKAFSCSEKPGIIIVKRFSRDGINVRRFSMEGDVELNETVTDEDLANEGSDAVAEAVPAEDVAVFSDEDAGIDEVVAPVNGGDVTPIVDSKTAEGYVEDTETEAETDDEPAVDQNCGDTDTSAIADSLKQFSKKNA